MTDQPHEGRYPQGYDPHDPQAHDRPDPQGYDPHDPQGYERHDPQGYERRDPAGYDPYASRQQPRQPQDWPGRPPHGDDDPQAHLQQTQQWQGRTWDTGVHRPVTPPDAAETSYLPPQTGGTPVHPASPAWQQQPSHDRGAYDQSAHGEPAYNQSAHREPAYNQSAYGEPAYGRPASGENVYRDDQHGQNAHGQNTYSENAHGQNTYGESPYGQQQYGEPAFAPAVSTAPPVPAPAPAAGPGPGSLPAAVAGGTPAGGPAAPAPGTQPQAGHGSAATPAGNARLTDAQRARLEGRSPVIEPGMQPAALTALLGLLLSGGAAIGTYALLVPLVLLQAVTAAGWFRLNGMWPARQGIALAFLGALVSDAVLLVAGRENAPAAILGSLGVWVLLCLVLQLRSHADPDERMYGLMATVVSAALAILATGHLGADPDAVTVGAAAVAVAVLARALPLPTPASVVVALLAAAGAGIAVGGMTGLGAKGALLGAGAAGCALIGHRVASYDYPSRFVHFTAGVALPLAASAPAVYVLGRALT